MSIQIHITADGEKKVSIQVFPLNSHPTSPTQMADFMI